MRIFIVIFAAFNFVGCFTQQSVIEKPIKLHTGIFVVDTSMIYYFINDVTHNNTTEIDAIKTPDIIINGDLAFYTADTNYFYHRNSMNEPYYCKEPEDSSVYEKSPFPFGYIKPKCPNDSNIYIDSGYTRVKIWIHCDGSVKSAKIMESSNKVFNECSLIAALQCKFTPAIFNNGPISVWGIISYRFRGCK